MHGYWQVPLDKESQKLTTFVTPWGRFKYLRGTMGFISSGEEFCRRVSAVTEGLPRICNVVDDFLLAAEDLQTHLSDTRAFLSRCRQHGVTLYRKKAQFAKEKVDFAGYMSEEKELRPTQTRLLQLRHFRRQPTSHSCVPSLD